MGSTRIVAVFIAMGAAMIVMNISMSIPLSRRARRVNPGASSQQVGRSGPNLKPGTVCVWRMSGLRNGMNTTQHSPSPASRAGTDLPTNVQAVSRAVRYVNTHRPRFQVNRAQPS